MKDLKPILEGDESGRVPLVIAGPCSAESEQQVLATARQLASNGIRVFRAGVWKPRTKPGGFEGCGSEALLWLAKVKEETGMLIATEVATRQHVEEALAAGVDMLWVGARTSTNPFAVQEVADTIKELGRTDVAVLVKNPVNPDLELWIGALERFYNSGIRRLGAVHRGFSAYGKHLYRNQPEWHIPIELRLRLPELPIICDPSHIGGRRDLILPLAQEAMDIGFDGLIIESHCEPDCALSDAAQQVTPADLGKILDRLVVRHAKAPTEGLDLLRRKIDNLDNDLLEVLSERLRVCREIGRYKREHGVPVVQSDRFNDIMNHRIAMAGDLGLGEEFLRNILLSIHDESVRQQIGILKKSK